MYLRDLFIDKWEENQASTQYQGSGMSHELSALLMTETIQFSKHVNHKPVFILSLHAKSAYDKIIRQIFIKELFFTNINKQAVIYIDNKLKHSHHFMNMTTN